MKHRGEYDEKFRRMTKESDKKKECPICRRLKWRHPDLQPGQRTHGWGSRNEDGSWEEVSMCFPHYEVASAHQWLTLTGGYE